MLTLTCTFTLPRDQLEPLLAWLQSYPDPHHAVQIVIELDADQALDRREAVALLQRLGMTTIIERRGADGPSLRGEP